MNPGLFVKEKTDEIKKAVGGKKVLLALSGGLDSAVCAALLDNAVPGQAVCIFVDHGLMRLGEGDEIEAAFGGKNLQFVRVNAEERFLEKLKGITDPEEKRKIIGTEFIRVFEEESAKFGEIPFLVQGTILPDIKESGKGSSLVKSHHNVGGLPQMLNFKQIIEPLKELYKNEVRLVGNELGLPGFILNRQPFPGPGLGVRIMGEITRQKLETLKKADAIFRKEVDSLSEKPDQYFAVLTDTLSVGIKEGKRTYDPVIALRAVATQDFMACGAFNLPFALLERAAERITGEIPEVSRVVYDITKKPPGTVEWV